MSADPLASFTPSLRARVRLGRLGPAPALLTHPDPFAEPATPPRPAPLLLWLHGRTVHKEIDSARFLRLSRAGIATLALDLPGHGERLDPALQASDALPELLRAGVSELDEVLAALWDSDWAPWIERDRLAIGGMSAGGMIALRRLGDPHPFRCAAVESSAGDFQAAGAEERFTRARTAGLDPSQRLEGWAPGFPLLALHSELDQVCALAGIQAFTEALQARYAAAGADPERVSLVTWPETGAPQEHAGFGRKAHEARLELIEFLQGHLLG